ncbi:O-antigen ligase family protein [Pantoea sp. GD03673]|uniref:O-antigen ligase family protein n=1 Tax=Pantoea sp. GD03673 TaxID=2975364 RepID=UPI00244A603A|nr:O-antigen ligase family protein [Pantoea sp. GD03673]MDH2068204.1 O-antigen ligase family protein [Pantoea sp. GD03673]
MVNFSVIALCLALSLNMFVTGLPQKIFYLVSYLSVASVLYGVIRRRGDFKENGFYIALFAVLIVFALIRLFWAIHTKGIETAPSNDAITNIGNYLLGAKRLLLGAFVLLSLAIYGNRVSVITLRAGKVLILVGLLITLGFGIHEHLYTENIRIKLTTEAASMSSYMILFIYCAWLWLSRYETHAYWKIADIAVLAVTFALLYLCGTRVTLIALIAVGLLFLLQTWRLTLLTNWRISALLVGVLAVLILMTSNRWVEGVQDIENYGSNSSTSLGARVAIWSGAVNFIEHHGGFATPDARTTEARQFITAHYPQNVEGYTNVKYNMHNEFLEVTTLQGWVGMLSLALLYLAVLAGWLKKCDLRGAALPVLALFICGLTDSVLPYNQTATIFIMALALCCLGRSLPVRRVNTL